MTSLKFGSSFHRATWVNSLKFCPGLYGATGVTSLKFGSSFHRAPGVTAQILF